MAALSKSIQNGEQQDFPGRSMEFSDAAVMRAFIPTSRAICLSSKMLAEPVLVSTRTIQTAQQRQRQIQIPSYTDLSLTILPISRPAASCRRCRFRSADKQSSL